MRWQRTQRNVTMSIYVTRVIVSTLFVLAHTQRRYGYIDILNVTLFAMSVPSLSVSAFIPVKSYCHKVVASVRSRNVQLNDVLVGEFYYLDACHGFDMLVNPVFVLLLYGGEVGLYHPDSNKSIMLSQRWSGATSYLFQHLLISIAVRILLQIS